MAKIVKFDKKTKAERLYEEQMSSDESRILEELKNDADNEELKTQLKEAEYERIGMLIYGKFIRQKNSLAKDVDCTDLKLVEKVAIFDGEKPVIKTMVVSMATGAWHYKGEKHFDHNKNAMVI